MCKSEAYSKIDDPNPPDIKFSSIVIILLYFSINCFKNFLSKGFIVDKCATYNQNYVCFLDIH